MDFIQPELPFLGVMTSFIGGRRENQDTCGYSETERGLLAVVCDGMGGGPGGKTASRLAVEAIISYVQASCRPVAEAAAPAPAAADDSIPTEGAETQTQAPAPASTATAEILNTPVANAEILREAVQAANTALRTHILHNPSFEGMGTTVTAMLINKDGAAVAHVGDSRIYQLRHKKIVFRTGDHSEVGKMVRNGILTEEQARLSAISNIITRAVGIGDSVEVDTATLMVQPGDRFVLCTDGVWGAMPEPELVKMFCKKGNLDAVVHQLNDAVEEAGIEKGGRHDNFSMIMVMALKDAMAAAAEVGQTGGSATPASGDKHKENFTLTLPKPGPRTIAAAVVALIVLAAILLIWKPWADKNEEPQEQTTELTEGTDQTPPEGEGADGLVNPQDTATVQDNTPGDNTAVAGGTNAEAPGDTGATDQDGTPAETPKPGETNKETGTAAAQTPSSPEEEVSIALNDMHIDVDFLKNRKTCIDSTLNTLNEISAKLKELQDDTVVNPTANVAREKAVRNLRLKVNKLKEYNDSYTKEEKDTLFYVRSSLYNALGDSGLHDRKKDKWQGAFNTSTGTPGVCNRLIGHFNAARKETEEQLKLLEKQNNN